MYRYVPDVFNIRSTLHLKYWTLGKHKSIEHENKETRKKGKILECISQ